MAFSTPILNYDDIPNMNFSVDYSLPAASTMRMDELRSTFEHIGEPASGMWSIAITNLYRDAWAAKILLRTAINERKGRIFMQEIYDYNEKRDKFLTKVDDASEFKQYRKEQRERKNNYA